MTVLKKANEDFYVEAAADDKKPLRWDKGFKSIWLTITEARCYEVFEAGRDPLGAEDAPPTSHGAVWRFDAMGELEDRRQLTILKDGESPAGVLTHLNLNVRSVVEAGNTEPAMTGAIFYLDEESEQYGAAHAPCLCVEVRCHLDFVRDLCAAARNGSGQRMRAYIHFTAYQNEMEAALSQPWMRQTYGVPHDEFLPVDDFRFEVVHQTVVTASLQGDAQDSDPALPRTVTTDLPPLNAASREANSELAAGVRSVRLAIWVLAGAVLISAFL